jgi:hypothetical protein
MERSTGTLLFPRGTESLPPRSPEQPHPNTLPGNGEVDIMSTRSLVQLQPYGGGKRLIAFYT